MKSTESKNKTTDLRPKYVFIYGLLFIAALAIFFDHFFETPVSVSDLIENVDAKDTYKPEVGYLAPPFAVRDLKGRRVKLSQYQGQVVLLNIWATWCGPCRVEMPGIERLYRRYRAQGFTVLAVSIDKGNPDIVQHFKDEYKLSFPILLDNEQNVQNLYPTFSIPSSLVIDKAGRIAAKVDGAKNWESEETFKAIDYLIAMS